MWQRNVAILLVLACSGVAAAADFDGAYSFGDSLTDSGSYIINKNPAVPPFLTTGRFTMASIT